MQDLRVKLEEAKKNKARRILITTDGVFSMDGTIASSMRFVISRMNLVPWFIMTIVMPRALWANTVKGS